MASAHVGSQASRLLQVSPRSGDGETWTRASASLLSGFAVPTDGTPSPRAWMPWQASPQHGAETGTDRADPALGCHTRHGPPSNSRHEFNRLNDGASAVRWCRPDEGFRQPLGQNCSPSTCPEPLTRRLLHVGSTTDHSLSCRPQLCSTRRAVEWNFGARHTNKYPPRTAACRAKRPDRAGTALDRNDS